MLSLLRHCNLQTKHRVSFKKHRGSQGTGPGDGGCPGSPDPAPRLRGSLWRQAGQGESPRQKAKPHFSCCSQSKADCASYHRSLASCTTVPPSGSHVGHTGGREVSPWHLGNMDLIKFPPCSPNSAPKGSELWAQGSAASRGQTSVQLSPPTVPSVSHCCLCLSFPLHKSATYLFHN